VVADLDSFDDLTIDERTDPSNVGRRQGVLDDFRRLRELLE